jgi:hypothetical protein
VVREHPSRLARISSVLVMLGSLVWVQWPLQYEEFGIASSLLFFGSLVAWIGMELADLGKKDSIIINKINDDVQKMNYILELIDRNQSYIIRNLAIETYIHDDEYYGLQRLCDYYSDDMFPFHTRVSR